MQISQKPNFNLSINTGLKYNYFFSFNFLLKVFQVEASFSFFIRSFVRLFIPIHNATLVNCHNGHNTCFERTKLAPAVSKLLPTLQILAQYWLLWQRFARIAISSKSSLLKIWKKIFLPKRDRFFHEIRWPLPTSVALCASKRLLVKPGLLHATRRTLSARSVSWNRAQAPTFDAIAPSFLESDSSEIDCFLVIQVQSFFFLHFNLAYYSYFSFYSEKNSNNLAFLILKLFKKSSTLHSV